MWVAVDFSSSQRTSLQHLLLSICFFPILFGSKLKTMLNRLISKPIFLLSFIHLILFLTPIEADDIIITICNNPLNYSSNTQFQTNLNLLLPSLINNTSPTGFYNTSIGQDPNQVYGLALCRPDISNADCRSCVTASAEVITRNCTSKKKATVLYNNCLIRISDQRFFSNLETEDWGYFWRGNSVLNPNLFNGQLESLMSSLSYAASSDDFKFKTGVLHFMEFNDIYGLAQCTRDLSVADCLSCLQFVVTKIPTCCEFKPGAVVVSPGCYIRYELFSFFQTSPPPPPPLNGGSSDEGNKKTSVNTVIIAVPVAIIFVLVFIISIFLLRRKAVVEAAAWGSKKEKTTEEKEISSS